MYEYEPLRSEKSRSYFFVCFICFVSLSYAVQFLFHMFSFSFICSFSLKIKKDACASNFFFEVRHYFGVDNDPFKKICGGNEHNRSSIACHLITPSSGRIAVTANAVRAVCIIHMNRRIP